MTAMTVQARARAVQKKESAARLRRSNAMRRREQSACQPAGRGISWLYAQLPRVFLFRIACFPLRRIGAPPRRGSRFSAQSGQNEHLCINWGRFTASDRAHGGVAQDVLTAGGE